MEGFGERWKKNGDFSSNQNLIGSRPYTTTEEILKMAFLFKFTFGPQF